MSRPYLLIGGLGYIVASLVMFVLLHQRAEMWEARWESCDTQRSQLRDSTDQLVKQIEAANERVREQELESERLQQQLIRSETTIAGIEESYSVKITELLARRPTATTELELCEEGRSLGVRP